MREILLLLRLKIGAKGLSPLPQLIESQLVSLGIRLKIGSATSYHRIFTRWFQRCKLLKFNQFGRGSSIPIFKKDHSSIMNDNPPLYLGFDLSTQQLKGIAVTSSLKAEYEVKFDFDADSKGFNVKKGVLTNQSENEVFAPLTMWLQAIDGVLQRFKDAGMDFSRVRGISGAGMQHGSVYWNNKGEQALGSLDPCKSLEGQLADAFAHPYSPNWQDASTQAQCDAFDAHLGDPTRLAFLTGSKAHHVSIPYPGITPDLHSSGRFKCPLRRM